MQRRSGIKMADKTWIIIGIIFGIIFLIGITTILIIVNQKQEKQEKINTTSMDLYLSIKANSIITSGNYTLINNGNILEGKIIKDSLNEIKNVSINNVEIFCEKEGYYPEYINKIFTEEEKSFNSSIVECNLDKIGIIKIRNLDNLSEGNSEINLNLDSDGIYKNPLLCVAWTTNIINVKSYLNESEITTNPIPTKWNKLVDKCFLIEQVLNNEDLNIKLIVKSEGLSPFDYVKVYVSDSDTILNNRNFEISSELNGKDIYGEDVEYIIK
jgi:hypothetical protein